MNKIKQTILIKKVRDGDGEAFREIYKFFIDRVHRYIFFRVPSAESLDLEQDVFLKLWDYLTNQEKEIRNLQALIYQIARTSIAGYYRKSGEIEKKKIILEEIEWKLDSGVDMSDDIEIKLKINDLRQKIAQLKNNDYKQIIELRILDDLSFKQIAQVLDKNESTVRASFYRALKELRKFLTQNQDDSKRIN